MNLNLGTVAFTLSDGTYTTKTHSYIRVFLSYDRQGNYAYFDNISLTKEAVPSYTYDEEDNLISVVANVEQESSYEHAYNRLTEYVDPKDGKYEYTYTDDTKLLETAKTQKGATYTYDAYGKPLTTTHHVSGHATAVNNNPLRYRGYVYDRETGFYYLQSRYYDPTTCRFVNEDIYYDTGLGFTGLNMFAYCSNNPIMSYDPTGTREPVGGGPISTETANERYLSCKRQREISLIATDNNSFIGGATIVSNDFLDISLDTVFWGAETGINTTKLKKGDFDHPITFFVQDSTDWWRFSEYRAGINVVANDYTSTLSISPFGIYGRRSHGKEALEIQVGVDKIGYTISYDFDYCSNTAGAYQHGYIRPWTIAPVLVLSGLTCGAASSLFAVPQLQFSY